MSKYIKTPILFDLRETLDCGQCFRWSELEAENDGGITWGGTAFGKYLQIKQTADSLYFYCNEADFKNIWTLYFDLDTNYNKIRAELSDMNVILKEAAEFAPGIRILVQDSWEALCSFIISQNNNISRIKGIVSRFCENFGEKNGEIFCFPTAEKISQLTVEDLAPIRSGFRAKYIISAAKAVCSGEVDFTKIKNSPVDFGRTELQKINGVGPKVADCALLYGFHKTECFPLDTWMKKAMAKFFPGVSPEAFGRNAGLAQQYIFHYSRMHPELFKD